MASHFSSQRPILGICLKRYAVSTTGEAFRLGTEVDIPIEIGLPHFIRDDQMHDDSPLCGNFKLSLQSVVCHRGHSVDSGHYISFVRGTSRTEGSPAEDARQTAPHSLEDSKHWLRFDDLAAKRIKLVDIEEAMKIETPYLLFYQIVPIEGNAGHIIDEDGSHSFVASDTVEADFAKMPLHATDEDGISGDGTRSKPRSVRNSQLEGARGRSPSLDVPRHSVVFLEPETRLKERKLIKAVSGFDNMQQHDKRLSIDRTDTMSRSSSQSAERRAPTFSRITGRVSREKLPFEGVQDRPQSTVSIPKTEPSSTSSFQNIHKEDKSREKSSNREGNGAWEKSSNKLGKLPPLSKSKLHKPDRDCTVM